MIQTTTGYPSIDRPWKQFYQGDVLNTIPEPQSMYDFLVACNSNNQDSVALNYFGTKLTFRELFEQVEDTAKALLSIGVKEGDVVTVISLSCIRSVVLMYALNRIGAVPSYVNVLAREDELVTYFQEAESKYVISLDLFAAKALAAAEKCNVRQVIVYSLAEDMPLLTKLGFQYKTRKLDTSFLQNPIVLPWKKFAAMSKNQPDISYKKDGKTLAFLGHTGGTTGFPKNVLMPDHSFNLIANVYRMCMEHGKGDSFLSGLVPYVIYSTIINIHMPLCLGLETILIPKFDSGDWHKYIRKYHPTHCCLIPAYAQGMLQNEHMKDVDMSCLKTFGLGGDGLTETMEENVNKFLKEHHSTARLLKGYGMTEVCATALTEFAFARRIGAVGIPLPFNNVMAYDNETQSECKYGESGEICLQCATRMIGYQNREDEMRNLIRQHPDGSQWIHTGDLGYIDSDGYLFLIGRMKRLIMTVIDGKVYKIPPQKVESVLSTDHGVHEICVVGTSDKMNRVLKAFVVPKKKDDTQLIARLKALSESVLQESMRPSFYEIRDSLPRTPAGKVDYLALEKECQ